MKDRFGTKYKEVNSTKSERVRLYLKLSSTLHIFIQCLVREEDVIMHVVGVTSCPVPR